MPVMHGLVTFLVLHHGGQISDNNEKLRHFKSNVCISVYLARASVFVCLYSAHAE